MSVDLDLDNIQGFVVRGYRLPEAAYVFLSVTDARAARRFLADLIGHVTTAAPWDTKPATTVNVAVSASGLRALGVSDEVLGSFDAEFRQGMSARADILGDNGPSAPEHWEAPFGSKDVHLLALFLAGDAAALAEREAWLDEMLGRSGCVKLSRQRAGALPGGVEHFGYADGFSQPHLEGLDVPPRTRQGAIGTDGGRPLRAGEFVLGYPDEEDVLPRAPKPDELASGGSYLAFRKLHEDVAAFRAALRSWSDGGGAEAEELLAAKIVGRWRDGSPLVLCPARPDPALAVDLERNNRFGYAEDENGYACPRGAHIRRANPRDALPFDGALVNRHRLIRRGLPYGDPLPADADDDGAERGVFFMCLQADLARQFEFIQSQWLNNGNSLRLGDDKDPLVGDHDGTGKHTINGAPPRFAAPLQRWVTTMGGEYFFVPGISGLRWLSQLEGGV